MTATKLEDLENRMDKIMLLLKELEEKVDELQKKVDGHVVSFMEACPHTGK